MRTRLLASAFALATAAVAGCGDDPTPPRTIEGTYDAVEAVNKRLPADVFLYASGGSIRVVQGTLTLKAPDTVVVVLWTQNVSSTGAADPAIPDTSRAHYRQQGTTLELTRMGTFPLMLESPATLTTDGSVNINVVRLLPVSVGLGTYRVPMRFWKSPT